MMGFFFGGPGCLIMAGYLGQTAAVAVLAAAVAFSLALAATWRETEAGPVAARPKATLAGFIRRPGAWALAVAAFLSAMTAVAGYGLSKLFLVDAGWPVEDVGRIGMAGGVVTVLLGCGGGAWLIGRLGARRALALGLAASGGRRWAGWRRPRAGRRRGRTWPTARRRWARSGRGRRRSR